MRPDGHPDRSLGATIPLPHGDYDGYCLLDYRRLHLIGFATLKRRGC